MSSLDFSHFKKIAQDKKRATLKHPDGHEVTIAVMGLSPKMRKELEDLPLHQADPDAPVEALDNDSPAQTDDDSDSEAPAAPPQQPAAAPAPTPGAAGAQPWLQAPGAEPPPAQPSWPPKLDDLRQEAQNASADYQTGKIEPKTFQSMFAKKDTLGKIGTIFGLMLSGAGSGLSGQSNALIDMMNKTIDNDLKAQQETQENKRNFYQLAMQHHLNQAQIANYGASQALTQAQTGAIPSEIAQREAETKRAKAQSGQVSAETAKTGEETKKLRFQNKLIQDAYAPEAPPINQDPAKPIADVQAAHDATVHTTNAAVQEVSNIVQKLPPNQQAQGAAILQNQIKPAADQKIEASAVTADGKTKTLQAMNPPPPVIGEHYQPFDFEKTKRLLKLAEFSDKPGGILNGASAEGAKKEMAQSQAWADSEADGLAAFTRLAKIKGGDVPGLHAVPSLLTAAGTAIGGLLGGVAGTAATPGVGTAIGATGGAGTGGTLGNIAGKAIEGNLGNIFERERQQEIGSLISKMVARGIPKDIAVDFANSHMPIRMDSAKTQESAFDRLVESFRNQEGRQTPNLNLMGVNRELPKYHFVSPLRKEEAEDFQATKAAAGQPRKGGLD